jgi:hypothetical protein
LHKRVDEMKVRSIKYFAIFTFILMFALLPFMTLAAEQAKSIPPPISQPMVTEAALAVNLASALGVSSTADEIDAESKLGEIGIAPRNGWIADYPVTPDIVGEVQLSVAAAADAGTLSISRDQALKCFGDTIAGFGLTVRSYASGESAFDKPVSCDIYPNPATINDAYSSEGPPIVTYYCPPPDYYYQYDWVPYPFWWTDFWFPGFFVLRDFDRHEFVHHHFMHFSNHFNDINRHHVFRVDPVDRFQGRTFAGIGVKPSHSFISTGVPHSSQMIFNSSRGGNVQAGRGGAAIRSGAYAAPANGGGGVHGGGGGVHGGGGGMHGGGGGMHGGGGGMHGGGGGMHGGGGGGGRR